MKLPPNFHFSQSSLQDFIDCRRRFQLRHLNKIRWPALQAQPALELERRLEAGREFHALIRKHELGVEKDVLESLIRDGDLKRWWQNYLHYLPDWLPEQRYPEIRVSASIPSAELALGTDVRLSATLDLLAVEPNARAVIVDWKTTRRPQSQAWLSERMQTRVYRFLLVQAGSAFIRTAKVEPEQVSMLYWFAEKPENSVLLDYDQGAYEEDGCVLREVMRTILLLPDDHFEKTKNLQQCHFCRYRSLCDRGGEAGAFDHFSGDEDSLDVPQVSFDFDRVEEIEY